MGLLMVSLRRLQTICFQNFQKKARVEAVGVAAPANEGPPDNFDATEGDLHKRMVYSKDVEVTFGNSAPSILFHELVCFFAETVPWLD